MEPNSIYLGKSLFLPRHHLPRTVVERNLSFQSGTEPEIDADTGMRIGTRMRTIRLWRETETHWELPREYIPLDQLEELGEPILVEEPDFAKTKLTSAITPWAHQAEALDAMEEHRRGVVHLGCGKGKSATALIYAARRARPCIVIVNSTTLLEQWREEADRVLPGVRVSSARGAPDRWDPWTKADLLLSTVQTLAKYADKLPTSFAKRFGISVYDEAHHMAAPYFLQAADLFYGDRFALTATPERLDNLSFVYKAHLGPVIYSDVRQDLIPNAVVHRLDWSPSPKWVEGTKDSSGTVHSKLLAISLGTLPHRNKYIIDLVVSHVRDGHDVLVLSHSRDMVGALYQGALKCGLKNAGMITGGNPVSPKERLNILRTRNPVFGTNDLAREALDKKSLSVVHMTTPFSSQNDLQQTLGRVQRAASGKDACWAHLYVDSAVRMSVRQGESLMTALRALKYPVEERKVVL